jgi:hypothetical protein
VYYSEIRSGGPPKDGIPAIDEPRFVSVGEADTWLEPREPVILLRMADEVRAYPIQVIMWHEIVNDTVAGVPVVVTWGSAGVFSRRFDGRTLTFRSEGGTILDEETGSEWNVLGEAVAGELEGSRLEPVVSIDHFWFSWAAFRPETRVYEPKSER